MRLSQVLLLTAGASTAVMALSAQDNPSHPMGQDPARGQDISREQHTPAPETPEADGILATWLLIENNNEIALSQIAQQRAQDPEVKQFAQAMVEAHRQMAQGLQPFAANVGYNGTDASAVEASATKPQVTDEKPTGMEPKPGAGGTPQEAGAGRTTPPAPAGASDRPSMRELDHVALLRELGRECLSSSRRALEEKQGADFDRCYVGMAIGAHMKANDAMTVFQRHASDGLALEIGKAQRMVADHLEQAKELAKRLEGHPRTAVSEKMEK